MPFIDFARGLRRDNVFYSAADMMRDCSSGNPAGGGSRSRATAARASAHRPVRRGSGRMQVRGGHVLGVPGRAWTAHIMLFRPVGMECRHDELMPELAYFADQPGLAIMALGRRGRGRRYDTCHGAFCRLTGDFRLRKSPQIVARAVLAGLIKKLFLLSGLAGQPLLGLLNC
jgi:hypothetical protein